MKVYIQICRINGKGKMTAAIGLVSIVGAEKKVFFAQSAKDQVYCEVKAIQSLLT
jgi:ATP:corrinoid adenosyltransferase